MICEKCSMPAQEDTGHYLMTGGRMAICLNGHTIYLTPTGNRPFTAMLERPKPKTDKPLLWLEKLCRECREPIGWVTVHGYELKTMHEECRPRGHHPPPRRGEKRTCIACQAIFKPRKNSSTQHYCSYSCYVEHRPRPGSTKEIRQKQVDAWTRHMIHTAAMAGIKRRA